MFYVESFFRVKEIIKEELSKVFLVIQDMELEIGIEIYDSYNIVLVVCFFVCLDDFWEVIFDVYECIKVVFNWNGIQVVYFEGVEMGKIGE